jgi:hypothetical protein
MPVRRAELLLLAALFVGAATGQRPEAAEPEPAIELHIAVAAAPQRGALPALAWFCDRWLFEAPFWPQERDRRLAFHLRWTAAGVTIGDVPHELDERTAVAGSLVIGATPPVQLHCSTAGIEDWYVPAGLTLPERWRHRLDELEAWVLDSPRTLATPIVIGHLAGALAADDPYGHMLRGASASCGDVTWSAWTEPGRVRVRGRSDGGLVLPAALFALAVQQGPAPHRHSLRAFAAADGDRAEAARQLGRGTEPVAESTLRALLHGDDRTRLVAIDALVRRGAVTQLPAIVAAGTADSPWAALAARDAIVALWPVASAEVRQRTRVALARSTCVELRSLDVERLPIATPTPSQPPSVAPQPVRALCWLACTAIGLLGWWLRERALAAKLVT